MQKYINGLGERYVMSDSVKLFRTNGGDYRALGSSLGPRLNWELQQSNNAGENPQTVVSLLYRRAGLEQPNVTIYQKAS